MQFDWQRYLLGSLRLVALLALAFSVALFVHYLDPANSGYCSGRSGCEAVRRSGMSYFGKPYLNLPLLGVVGYAALLSLSFVPLSRSRRAAVLGLGSLLGAVSAVVLIVLQAAVVGAFCWLCMVVDVAAIVCGVLGVLLFLHRDVVQHPFMRSWAWGVSGFLLAVSPALAWAVKPMPEVPKGVLALYQPGKINVVEFADYQCPFCRTLHPILKRLNREYGEKVNFHQLHMPLPGHPHAKAAAAAAVCAENEYKGHEMKELLFTAHLDEEAPLEHAEALGFDAEAFQRCMLSPETEARIQRDVEILVSGGFRGLPTTFIGDQRIVGLRAYPVLKEAYESALHRDTPPSLPPIVLWPLVFAVALGVAYAGRIDRKSLAAR